MQAPTLAAMLADARRRADALRSDRAALERRAALAPRRPALSDALRGPDVAVIAEVKRRSPSAGAIRPDLNPAALAAAYAAGGAVAISVLTDESFFGGSLADLAAVAQAVPLPVLRKDFIIDALQVLEARSAGASAILLIARALEADRLAELGRAARDVGLDTLVEVHAAGELDRALAAAPTALGVNSRNLDTLRVDADAAARLIARIPPGVVVVAESGIAARRDVERFASAGADAVLVGTSLARSADPAAAVRALRGVVPARRPRLGVLRGG